ncbi:MAG: hypothetical protein AAFQ61_06465 [Cyanobacteria bacterium J06626_23]
MLISFVVLNLTLAMGCLLAAYGCWRLQRRLRQLEVRLIEWEYGLSQTLPGATRQLRQSGQGLIGAQRQYALWQRRQAQLLQLIKVLQMSRWLWRRF